ncbi:hypothetical protein DFJ73DRAFT_653903 [Zopfochytrium polystomum]|nr:hypothetical protein DFJ73DRAFT_653903 [Zopfochytrium polystomum]
MAAAQIAALNDKAVDIVLESDPLYAPVFGIRGKLEDQVCQVSKAYKESMIAKVKDLLADATAVEKEFAGSLSKQDADDLRFLKFFATSALEHEGVPGEVGYSIELSEDHMNGNLAFFEMGFGSYQPASTPEDFANYKKRLARLPKVFDDIIDNFRHGIRRNVTLPKSSIELLIKKCTTSSFEGLEGPALDAAVLDGLMAKKEEAKKVMGDEAYLVEDIKEYVLKGYAKVKKFLEEEYLPHARKNDGLFGLDGYKEAYEGYIFKHTSVRYKADEIHEIGLKEVDRIWSRMEEVKNQCGFEGTVKEFQNAINDREKFPFIYFEKPEEEVIPYYKDILVRAEEKMKEYFERFPKFQCAIDPVPANMEAQMPLAFYMPGTADKAGSFRANLRLHKTKPRHVAVAVCLHEAMPGHHHQLSIALENENQHVIRKMNMETAYAEGYGLYSEFLGEEMGFYTNPFDMFGRLECEMQRACRLVVDSGLHAKGWTIEQGVEYMAARLSLPREELVSEVRRYCVMPGQALAYKIGEIKMKELRARAEKELGEKFSIKKFHSAMLDQGSLPLGVLEEVVNDYIKNAKQE